MDNFPFGSSLSFDRLRMIGTFPFGSRDSFPFELSPSKPPFDKLRVNGVGRTAFQVARRES